MSNEMPESVKKAMQETKTVTVGDINKALFGSSSVGQLESAMFSLQSAVQQLQTFHPELANALRPALGIISEVSMELIDNTAKTLKVYESEGTTSETGSKDN